MHPYDFNREIQSERLLLRKMTLEDAVDIFDYASDVQVSKFTTWENHKNIEDTLTFLKIIMQKYENNQPSDWGIVHKETNKVIGTCGWVYINESHHRAEIGYALSPIYWNQGIITESMKQVLNLGFNELDINRIEARCMIGNLGSERVMIKLGMQFEGLIREQMFVKESYINIKMYSILKNEWIQQRFPN
ncbi:GNAT family N-acetyltransferase [Paenibacillus alba]|uniref:GNAT family N-acetyltransferase n=1 Tax=Paenibacillus alba TaxID=1197127 RepID=UPI001563F311|nr:GNAT family N-acetyltransferase [Paenibacillus alba]NQX66172.1 GNAT family N-acetyltransferase [Paenibacillus alba]